MRAMTSAALAALTSPYLMPAIFVQATFANETIYVWSGVGDLTWNGQTWQGIGSLGSVTVIEEGATVQARGITLQMGGIQTALLADVLQEMQLGAPVSVFLGLFDGAASPPVLIDSPINAWTGRMDQPTIEVGGETATLSINCESRLIDMDVAVDRRYTQDDQAIDYPGDLGFQFVNSIQAQTIYWGATPNGNNL